MTPSSRAIAVMDCRGSNDQKLVIVDTSYMTKNVFSATKTNDSHPCWTNQTYSGIKKMAYVLLLPANGKNIKQLKYQLDFAFHSVS